MIRKQVEDKVGVIEFKSSLPEEECRKFCRKYFEQKKDELISLRRQFEKDKPRWWGKRYFHRKSKGGPIQSTKT